MSPAPPPAGRLARLADLAFRRRRAVVAAWVVALVAAFAGAGLAGDWSADYSTPGSESRAAAAAAAGALPAEQPGHRRRRLAGARGRRGSAPSQERIDRLARDAGGLEGIGRGTGAAGAELSRDGTIGVLRLPLTELPGAIPDRHRRVADRAGARRRARTASASSWAAS